MSENVRPEITIRPFVDGDALQVRELFVLVNRLLSPPNMRDAFEAYIARSLIEEMDRIVAYYGERDGGFWVALKDHNFVGMFGLERVSPDALELRRCMLRHPLAATASRGGCCCRRKSNVAGGGFPSSS